MYREFQDRSVAAENDPPVAGLAFLRVLEVTASTGRGTLITHSTLDT